MVNIADELDKYTKEYKLTYLKDSKKEIGPALSDEDLELARIYLLYSPLKIRLLSDYTPELADAQDVFWRKVTLTAKAIKGIELQMECLNYNALQLPPPGDYYVVFNKEIGSPSISELNSIFLGIEIFVFLEHQNVDRYRYLRTQDFSKESVNMFDTFINTAPKENIMVFSGGILHTLGTTYTSDIDAFLFGDIEVPHFEDFVDYHLLKSDDQWKHKKVIFPAHENWWKNIWPQLIGATSLNEVFHNPRFHYSFLGVKFMCLDATIKKLISRASSSAYVDLMMLRSINDIDIGRICIPNSSIRQGKLIVNDSHKVEQMYKTIKRYFKEWHNIEYDIDFIRKSVPRCHDNPEDIYKGVKVSTDDTRPVIKFHNSIKDQYIKKYKGTKLLDIGSGYLRDQYIWEKSGFSEVVCIEPSVESWKRGMERKKDFVTFINGYGDRDWTSDAIYAPVLNSGPYDLIVFSFTIHYMIDNMDVVMKNLSKVIGKNTKIIVTCLNKDIIFQRMKNGIYEVRFSHDPTFGLYMGKSELLVYFAGVYGVSHGSFEKLLDIQDFNRRMGAIGMKQIERRPFTSFPNSLNDKERLISAVQQILVYGNDNDGNNSSDNSNKFGSREESSSGGNNNDNYVSLINIFAAVVSLIIVVLIYRIYIMAGQRLEYLHENIGQQN